MASTGKRAALAKAFFATSGLYHAGLSSGRYGPAPLEVKLLPRAEAAGKLPVGMLAGGTGATPMIAATCSGMVSHNFHPIIPPMLWTRNTERPILFTSAMLSSTARCRDIVGYSSGMGERPCPG